jgi:Ca2+-binding RTX toxin-like protein
MTAIRTALLRLSTAAALVAAPLTFASAAQAATPTCFGHAATIVGTDGQDTIHGTPDDDVIVAGDGPDEVFGEGGDDIICGGDGSFDDDDALGDRLHGGAGNDRIDGGPGNDVLYGDGGKDKLYGRDDDDSLSGGKGNDEEYGELGWDGFSGGPGNDRMVGGPDSEPAGTNSVSYIDSTSPVVVDLRADTGTGEGHDVVKHIWTATGSLYDDVIRGTPRNDVIYGECGNDRIYGRGGDDRLFGHNDDGGPCQKGFTDDDTVRGGGGNDSFHGEFWAYKGTDTIYGGRGNDSLQALGGREHFFGGPGADGFFSTDTGSSDPMYVDLAAGTYRIHGNHGTLHSVTEVGGSQGDDVLLGGPGPDYLMGGEGTDVLRGRGGDDVLRGDYWRGRDQYSMWKDKAYGGGGTDNCIAEITHSCERSDKAPPPF